jgi:hypothetical protein
MVVLGDLAANKAGVVEGLTGVRFPTNPRARPNHPTEIICHQSDRGECSVRLRACFLAEEHWRERLSAFIRDNADPLSIDFAAVSTTIFACNLYSLLWYTDCCVSADRTIHGAAETR